MHGEEGPVSNSLSVWFQLFDSVSDEMKLYPRNTFKMYK